MAHRDNGGWEDDEEIDPGATDSEDEWAGNQPFSAAWAKLLMEQLISNVLRVDDLQTSLEALSTFMNDPAVDFSKPAAPPAGLDEVKEYIVIVLSSAMEKFTRADAFLRVHQDQPDALFSCLYHLVSSCNGLAAVVADHSDTMREALDMELCALLNITASVLYSRSAVWGFACTQSLPPDLPGILARARSQCHVPQPAEYDEQGEEDEDTVMRGTDMQMDANAWQVFLVQGLVGTRFVEYLCQILEAADCHSLQLHSAALHALSQVCQVVLMVRPALSVRRTELIHKSLLQLLAMVSARLASEPDRLLGGKERSYAWLSSVLSYSHDLCEMLGLPNTEVVVVQRALVTELLKSSNFSRLLSAVQECRALLEHSRGEEAAVSLEEQVEWLDRERIVRHMLRVNLHQSQYAEAVLGMLRVLAECGQLKDEHLDLLWGVTEQEGTFDAVKTNVCHMIKQLAPHMAPQQLDRLFSKFETSGAGGRSSDGGTPSGGTGAASGGSTSSGGGGGGRSGRSVPDTLRLLDLLRRLANSDKASAMAGKLLDLVWELTTPADAPPELLASNALLDVLEGYAQHSLLQNYIARCVTQLRSRQNVYTALTVLQNLLLLWAKMYGWQPPDGRSQPPGGPWPLSEYLSKQLDHQFALSSLLVDGLCDFMGAAARWMEERQQGRGAAAGAAAPGAAAGIPGAAAGGVAGVGAGGSQGLVPPGQGCYSYQQIVRRYLEVFRLVSCSKEIWVDVRLVEALWDAVVLRPNTPEDMPTGLDLMLAVAGEDPAGPAAEGPAPGASWPFDGPLLSLSDMAAMLQGRMTALPPEHLPPPAFKCLAAWFEVTRKAVDDALVEFSEQGVRHVGGLTAQQVARLQDSIRKRGKDYVWAIVLDCQRADVTASASRLLMDSLYGKGGKKELISDTRQRLMASAALLLGVPPDTSRWEGVQLPQDAAGEGAAAGGMLTDANPDQRQLQQLRERERAMTRVTRCLHLLEQLAAGGKGEDSMPPVPVHSASWQGTVTMYEVATPDSGRLKVGCGSNEYVGLLRRKVADRLGVDPACVRLFVGGQELKVDNRALGAALPPGWSARQGLVAQVSGRPNKYTRFGEEWWAAWHGSRSLAQMYHDDQLYRVLLLLADLPHAPAVRSAAARLLQQLPTCAWVPGALLGALLGPRPAAALRQLLLGASGEVERPGLLLYMLQALYALLQPSYPEDLLPLTFKPWDPQQQQQQRQGQPGSDGSGDVAALTAAAGAGPAGGANASSSPPPPPGGWWQVVAAGDFPQRLLPVLCDCVPLLAEVVDRVMVQGQGAGQGAEGGDGMDAGRQPRSAVYGDLSYLRDFQWVAVFLLCHIYTRARRMPAMDSPAGTAAGGAAGISGGGSQQRGTKSPPAMQQADSHSSSLGPGELPPSATAAGLLSTSTHAHTQHTQQQGGGSMLSGGQDSEAVTQEAAAGCGMAAHHPHGHANTGAGGAVAGVATPPEVTSADPEASQLPSDNSTQLPTPNGSGQANVAAALVSGLAVSSRDSPMAVSAMETATGTGMATTAAAGAAGMGVHGQQGQGVEAEWAGSNDAGGATAALNVPVAGSSSDMDVGTGVARRDGGGAGAAAVGRYSPAAASPGHGQAAGVAGAAGPPAAAPAVPLSPDQALQQCLGARGLACMVSLLIRLAHDAGCLWGYSGMVVGPAAASAGATGAPAPSRAQLRQAVECATQLGCRALGTLVRLLQLRDEALLEAFMADDRSVPMLLETLSCPFSAALRDAALQQLEGLLADGGDRGPHPRLHAWALRALVALRGGLSRQPHRLDSCLELYTLLCRVLSQLPELASPCPESRLLADRLLGEEVAQLDAGAEELLQPGRALLLQGKLCLVRELVGALDRLGVGLGANGRPGLISILLNRYLFPEARYLWVPASAPAPLTEVEGALRLVAGAPAVRREALLLVQTLMAGCPANLEAGLRDLSALHYENGLRILDRKFDIGGDCVRGEGCYVGLRNGGATCYMNSVLQQLVMQPRIRDMLLGARGVEAPEQQDSVFHQLQVIFAHLRLGRASCFHPRGFWQAFKDYDGQPIDVHEHQDAYEFFTRLQDAVDSHLRSTGQPPAMQAVMGGKFAAQIICKDVNYRSEREEEFYQISVDVKGFDSLEKSLEGYVAGELMEGDNAYYCEELGQRVAAVRRTCIRELPQTLVVHLKRFEYDHLNMTRYKLRDRFEFPVVLDMFRYTADGLAALEGGAAGAAGAAAGAAGPGAGGADGAAAGTGGEGAGGVGVGSRPRNHYLYELKGIVVHSGTAFAGHYYSFIKERPRLGEDGQVTEGSWYRFDDRSVTPWSVADLEADCFGGRAGQQQSGGGTAAGARGEAAERPYSAYMLFYERRDATCYEHAVMPRSVPMGLAAGAGGGGGAAAAGNTAAAAGGNAGGAAPMEEGQEGQVAAGAGGEATEMETEGPSGSGRGAAAGGLPTTPHGMPLALYQAVLRDNLTLMHKLHVLNKEYFAFVRQVVEVTWESVLAGRKARRRDLHAPAAPPPSPGAGPSAAPAPAPLSPLASSSAPSTRNEELDETVTLSARLAVSFLLNIFYPAPLPLRSDLPAWRDLLQHLTAASPRATVELLRLVAGSHHVLMHYYMRIYDAGVWLSDVIGEALAAAWRVAAPLVAEGGGGGGSELVTQLVTASLELVQPLCTLLSNALSESSRSDPILLAICRTLTHLVSYDATGETAAALLSRHLHDVFALVAHLLGEGPASPPPEPECITDMSAAYGLIRALLDFCVITTSNRSDPFRPPPTASAGRPARYRLSAGMLDRLCDAGEAAVFVAAVSYPGLLSEPAVREVLQVLMYDHVANTLRFLRCLMDRFDEGEALAGTLVELADGVAPVLDIPDALYLPRINALLVGAATSTVKADAPAPPLLPSVLRMLVQAAQKQTLSWGGLAAGHVVGQLYAGHAHETVRGWARVAMSFGHLWTLATASGAVVRQLGDFVRQDTRHAGQTAAQAANTAALKAKASKAQQALSAVAGTSQELVVVVQLRQEQQQQQRQQEQAAAAVAQQQAAEVAAAGSGGAKGVKGEAEGEGEPVEVEVVEEDAPLGREGAEAVQGVVVGGGAAEEGREAGEGEGQAEGMQLDGPQEEGAQVEQKAGKQ